MNTILRMLAFRFKDAPLQLSLDLRRVPLEQRDAVTNLAFDAPNLETFQRELPKLIAP